MYARDKKKKEKNLLQAIDNKMKNIFCGQNALNAVKFLHTLYTSIAMVSNRNLYNNVV